MLYEGGISRTTLSSKHVKRKRKNERREQLNLNKMNNHEGFIRGYHRSSKAWYAKAIQKDNIEVGFGMYHPDGGTSGEITMEWVELSGKLCARLKCFEDGWSALSSFTDLIQKMDEADSELIQEEDFCKMLDECGFKDLTQYNDPYQSKEMPNDEMITLELPKGKAKQLGLI